MDKSILETIKETVGNVLYTIVSMLKKYKKHIILLIIACVLVFGIMWLLQFLKEQKGKVYLSDQIKEDLNCSETSSCVYTTNTGTENYVWYSGFLWRIVKINDDGSIKLILNESVGVVNHYNGLNNDYLESFIRLWLNEGVFLKGLHSPEEFLVDYDFCYGNENVECNDTVKDKVGLLTYNEYKTAGGKSSYLNIGVPFWLITRKNKSNTESYIVDELGELTEVSTSEYYQVRPVINLRKDIMIDPDTKGTMDNPYVLKGDEAITADEYLNSRYTGEFIKFAGKVWRIAEINENYTKLVLYGKDTKMTFGVNNIYSDKDNSIKTFIDNVYYNILKGALPEIDKYLTTGTFYGGPLSKGDAYTNVKINVEDYKDVVSKIGILSLGELFSGNDLGLSDDDMTWTITPVLDSESEIWLSNGKNSDVGVQYAVRPVIYLQKEVYVIAGSGDGRTRETAYELGIETQQSY